MDTMETFGVLIIVGVTALLIWGYAKGGYKKCPSCNQNGAMFRTGENKSGGDGRTPDQNKHSCQYCGYSEWREVPHMPAQKQITNYGVGVASLVFSLTAGVVMLAGFIYESYDGSVFIWAGIFGFVGFALGIAGLFQKGRKKLFAILGMVVAFPVFLVLALGIAFLYAASAAYS